MTFILLFLLVFLMFQVQSCSNVYSKLLCLFNFKHWLFGVNCFFLNNDNNLCFVQLKYFIKCSPQLFIYKSQYFRHNVILAWYLEHHFMICTRSEINFNCHLKDLGFVYIYTFILLLYWFGLFNFLKLGNLLSKYIQ